MTSQRNILIAGASGLVGQCLLTQSLADTNVNRVHILVRKTLNIQHEKLTEHVVDFTHIPELPNVNEVYLAIGTTIKQAGSQQAFRSVDYEINLTIARMAAKSGVARLGLVSAMGANSSSRFFYNRVKGDLENAISELPFKTLVIAQPSLLQGLRTHLNQPARLGESIANSAFKLLSPLIPLKYHPISAHKVANALLTAVSNETGRVKLSSENMQ